MYVLKIVPPPSSDLKLIESRKVLGLADELPGSDFVSAMDVVETLHTTRSVYEEEQRFSRN